MKGEYESVKIRVLEFTARFGFVTRELYFAYLSPVARTQKYQYLRQLLKDGFLMQARTAKEVYFLTTKARDVCGIEAIPARSVYLVPHDILVAKFFLELSSASLISQYWTEHDLKSNASEARLVLGTSQLLKFPDLILELEGKSGPLKVAVEIERSQKMKSRYRQIAFNYLQAKGVDLLLFGCGYRSIEQIILSAFNGELFEQANKRPATFLLSDLEKSGIEMPAQFCGHKMSMRKMLLAALEIEESGRNFNRYDCSTPVPQSYQMKKEENLNISIHNGEIAPTTCLPLALRAS